MSMIENKFIVIEGNIGAGKTTLSQQLAGDIGAKLVLETFEDNPFLPKFYHNKERYAFPLELSFLASRYKQLVKDIEQKSLFQSVTVADYYLMKSFIFARITLSEDEFNLYREFFELIKKNLIKPDVLFFIHRDVDELQKNIQERGRDYEKNMESGYLEKVTKGYFEYLRKVDDFPVVVIDSNHADYRKRDHYQQFLSLLEQPFENGMLNVKIG